MLDNRRIREAEANVRRYLEEGLLKKQQNETAKAMYLENSELSLQTAKKLLQSETEEWKPYLWIMVTSYYAMYYIANAVLLQKGYRVGDRISHKVTNDALIVLIRDKLRQQLLEEFEDSREDALELTAQQTDTLLQTLDHERTKRSKFQYQMDEQAKRGKALTSFERAKTFVFELKKLLR